MAIENRGIDDLDATHGEESMGRLLKSLAGHSAALVRDEIVLVRQELIEKAQIVKGAAIMIAVGLFTALLAMIALLTALTLVLATEVGVWQSALIVGSTLLVIAFLTAYLGMKKLSDPALKRMQTAETMEENKRWLKEIV